MFFKQIQLIFGLTETEGYATTVTQKTSYLKRLIARRSVNDRVRSAGAISQHATDHGAVGSGGLRAKHQPMFGERHVELIAYNPRLYAHPTFFGVDLKDLGKMP